MNLKDRAVYRLPNGRELVATLTCDDKIVLFSLSTSESGLYELNSAGRLLVDGQLTAWQSDDLLETDRIAKPEMTEAFVVRSVAADGERTNEESV